MVANPSRWGVGYRVPKLINGDWASFFSLARDLLRIRSGIRGLAWQRLGGDWQRKWKRKGSIGLNIWRVEKMEATIWGLGFRLGPAPTHSQFIIGVILWALYTYSISLIQLLMSRRSIQP